MGNHAATSSKQTVTPSTPGGGLDRLPPLPDKAVFDRIASLLQAFYADLPQEPVPERLLSLLDRIHQRVERRD